MDDFEAFRKRKKEQQQASAKAKDVASQNEALGWKDGFGPTSGHVNPKVKGFILGRYRSTKVDPAQLNRPAGYEATHLGDDAKEARQLFEKVEAAAAKIMAEAEHKIAMLYEKAERMLEAQHAADKRKLKGFQKF